MMNDSAPSIRASLRSMPSCIPSMSSTPNRLSPAVWLLSFDTTSLRSRVSNDRRELNVRREVDQLRGEFEAAGRDLDQACARSWTRYANHGAGLASSHAFDVHRRCHGSLVGAGGHAG